MLNNTVGVHHGVAMTGIIAHISGGRLIDAIKSYRVLNDVGLKEAKDACEAIKAALNFAVPAVPVPAKEQYVVISRYQGEYDWGVYHPSDKADAEDFASGCVDSRDEVYVARVVSKAVTERHMKAV